MGDSEVAVVFTGEIGPVDNKIGKVRNWELCITLLAFFRLTLYFHIIKMNVFRNWRVSAIHILLNNAPLVSTTPKESLLIFKFFSSS